MLTYNIKRVIRARGIDKPYSYFVRNGFSSAFSSRLKRNLVKSLRLGDLERICLLLKCTPNDLMEWTDDNDYNLDKGHPMQKLIRKGDFSDLAKTISEIPFYKVEEINKMIKEKLQEEEDD